MVPAVWYSSTNYLKLQYQLHGTKRGTKEGYTIALKQYAKRINSANTNDSKMHNSSIIGRVRNHALPVANALKQVGLGARVFRPAANKLIIT